MSFTWPLLPPPPPTPGPLSPRAYSPEAYARQLRALLPRGSIWRAEPDSLLGRLLLAIGDELARVDSRGADLLEEADPRTATETLEDWERMLGLPDDITPELPASIAERQQNVVQKLLRRGGQTPAYYVALAQAAGYTVSIVEGFGAMVMRVGFRVGDRCYGAGWAHLWEVVVQPPTGSTMSHAELEAIIRSTAPAHTAVRFTYL